MWWFQKFTYQMIGACNSSAWCVGVGGPISIQTSYLHEECPILGDTWRQALQGEDPWPVAVKLHEGKMYRAEKLCVPKGLTLQVMGTLHLVGGHVGQEKMVKEMKMRYCLGNTLALGDMAK